MNFLTKIRKKLKKKIHKLANDEAVLSKGNFKDFMSKEISEQPEVIKKCINEYLDKIRKEINIKLKF